MTPKTLVILNPAAKGEKARHLRQRIEALCGPVALRLTEKPGDAEAFAERAVEQGYHKVIAAGGDGTVNEVVNGIAESHVHLGILPVGTMNVFAAEIGMPQDIKKCWEIIEAGHSRKIDLPKANDQFFVQLAGVGLDAQIVQETNADLRKNFGPLSYLVAATQIAARKPPRLHVEMPGRPVCQASFALIGNGRFYGGPFEFFKRAKIDDGLLDVLLFEKTGHLDLLRYLQGVLFGKPEDMPDVEYLQTRSVTITADQDGIPIEVDGEVLGALPVEFRFSKRKLHVIVPEKHAQK